MRRSRLSQARSLLIDLSCEALIVTDTIEATYLSGFSASQVALIISDSKATIVTDFRYADAVRAHCKKNPQWSFVQIEESLYATLGVELATCVSIGFQDTYITVANYYILMKHLPFAKLVPAGKEISNLFNSKLPDEISAIEEAAHIADKAYELLIPKLTQGLSEYDVARKLNALCLSLGSDGPSFETIVLFGERSALPHGTPSKERLLQQGDWLLTDFGCTVNGFCSDMTRTAVFGKASQKQKELYAIVLEAQQTGRDLMKPGMKASELDRVVRDRIVTEGYGEAFGHGTGHGVGRRIHEAPALNTKNETILKEGMAVTIEPGIYLSNFGGVRIEDLVEITTTGIRCLSTTPRTLLEID